MWCAFGMNHISPTASSILAIFLPATLLSLTLLLTQPSAYADESLRWQSPVGTPYTVERQFHKPPKKWSAGHRGVDFTATPTTQIVAPEGGRISFSGKVVDRTVITVTHPDGKKSSFEPVSEALPAGTNVSKGERIATVDPSIHHCPGVTHCVHWGVREAEEYINPLLLIDTPAPSVLLPIGDNFSA